VAIVTANQNLLTVSIPTLNGAETSNQATATVTLQPGSYFAQVLATAATESLGGTFSVQVVPAGGNTNLLSPAVGVIAAPSPPPSSAESVLQAQFTVTVPGSYTLTATDRQFPVPLSAAPTILVLNDCGSPPMQGCVQTEYFTAPGSTTLPAGIYDLYSFADAGPVSPGGPAEGLYSISVVGAGNTVVYGATVPVGQLPAASSFSVPSAGTVSLTLTDLALGNSPPAFLGSLASLQAIVTQGANPVLAAVTGPSGGTPSTFSAAAVTAQLFVAATPNGKSGQSAWGAYLTEGGAALADFAAPVVASGDFGYAFPTGALAAGSYSLSVYDYQTPTPFSALNGLAEQHAAVLASTSGSSNFAAAAGIVNLLVFPALTASSANGLFGLALAAQGSDVYQATQGVGALFSSQTVNVTTAGSYNVRLTDLGFPASFDTIAVIVTQGSTQLGEVVGSDATSFAATPGAYVLNVLAQVGTGYNYGLYGLEMNPVPVVSLTPSATSVSSGQNVSLSWTATNATNCVASGGWSGAQALSGSNVSVGTITQNTSYTLTCTGAGGATPQTVQVSFAASSSKGGGGAFSPGALLALSVLAGLNLRRRRAMLPG
jgi:hypothetical protein